MAHPSTRSLPPSLPSLTVCACQAAATGETLPLDAELSALAGKWGAGRLHSLNQRLQAPDGGAAGPSRRVHHHVVEGVWKKCRGGQGGVELVGSLRHSVCCAATCGG